MNVPSGTFHPVHIHESENPSAQKPIDVPTGTSKAIGVLGPSKRRSPVYPPAPGAPAMGNLWNVPTGTLGAVLHINSTALPQFHLAFEMRTALCCVTALAPRQFYGTRHRCCQSEGRRGENHDCHQPS